MFQLQNKPRAVQRESGTNWTHSRHLAV